MERRTALRGGLVASAALLGAMTLLAATSWACTPQASLKVDPTSGAAGDTVKVSGSTFDAAGQPVRIFWGGASGTQVATATVSADRKWATTFVVPQSAGGVFIVSATQKGADGNFIAGSPVNTTFRVEGPAATAAAATSNVQDEPQNTITEPAQAPAVEAAPATPVQASAPAAAPRVRVAAPSRTPSAPAAAPVQAAASGAAVEATPPAPPAPPAVEPAPAAPARSAAPAPEPARRSVMVSMAGDESDGSPALAIALVGVGLLLALGASAVVLASRREGKAPAKARR